MRRLANEKYIPRKRSAKTGKGIAGNPAYDINLSALKAEEM